MGGHEEAGAPVGRPWLLRCVGSYSDEEAALIPWYKKVATKKWVRMNYAA